MSDILQWQGALYDYFRNDNLDKSWETVGDNGAEIIGVFADESNPDNLAFADLSPLPRVGIKTDTPPPATQKADLAVNRYTQQADGSVIARLGSDEWLYVANAAGQGVADIPVASRLPRRDSHFCFGISGEQATAVLSRLSAIPPPQTGEVQQTLVAGIGSIVFPAAPTGTAFYWLGDAAYAVYSWQILRDTAAKISTVSGGAVGWLTWRASLKNPTK